MGPSRLIKPKAAAEYLQVSEKTLAEWRRTGTGPTFQRLSHTCVRYFQSDIDYWLKERTAAAKSPTDAKPLRLGIEVRCPDAPVPNAD